MSFVYPTNAELQLVAQNLVNDLTMNDPLFQIMPLDNADTANVMWEQEDDYTGLMNVRGIGGKPGNVAGVGSKRYVMTPGYYGEFKTIDEVELTERRMLGSFNQPTNIDDLVLRAQRHLIGRRLHRIRSIGWTLLSTGTFSVASGTGEIIHTDTYSPQTYTASVVWATAATSTPLADFRAVKLLQRGRSVNFGRRAKAYMNQATLNAMLNNTNASDIGGKRIAGGNSVNDLGGFNRILLDNDLPEIVTVDDGYLDSTGTFQLFCPNNKVVVVGERADGSVIGNFKLTRNANNTNMEPGFYDKVVDNGDRAVPRLIEVHSGFNGGPALYFPSAIVIMTV